MKLRVVFVLVGIVAATVVPDPDPSAIVLSRVERFEVFNIDKARTAVQLEVMVTRPAGREYGEITLFHDRYRRIKNLEGRVLDESGRVVQKLKKEHIEDLSAVGGESLFEEGRVRTARLYHNDYPYRVEYSYELEHTGLLNWPSWYPGDRDAPTLHTSFEIVAPRSMHVRYALSGPVPDPVRSFDASRQILKWEAHDLAGFEPEPWGPSWQQQRASVLTAPTRFQVDGIPGEMTSWSGFGAWYRTLMHGRDDLPESVSARVRDLVANTDDPVEKARRVYAFMQDRTRYISVQLGIGRWQPEAAELVHERGYGDCKALTNYTLALLKEAGVAAYPALIRNGLYEPPLREDFPCNQFNHVVLYLPATPESVWLECTSQTMPFGKIGASNEDRLALVVKPGGGELMRTPRSEAESNLQRRTAMVEVEPDGDARAVVEERYTGNVADAARGVLGGTGQTWRESLQSMINLPHFDVVSADRHDEEARRDTVGLDLSLDISGLATRSGSRLFLQPNLMEKWTSVPPETEKRTQPVVFAYAFVREDSIVFRLPERFDVEALPKRVDHTASFGRYRSNTVFDERERTLTYTRLLRIDAAEIPPESYHEVVTFFADVAKADGRQAVLKRSP